MTRMTDDEALELLRSRDLLGVGARAHEVRERLVPGPRATYIIDRNINYTNVCVSGCRFCAFHCKPGAPEAYVLSREEIHEKIQETLDLGGTAIMMQGGLHPELDVTYFEELFRSIKERFDITIHSLSAPEIVHIARVSDTSVREVLRRLKAAGLDSLPGGGAEILVDRVREQTCPGQSEHPRVAGRDARGSQAGHPRHGHDDVRERGVARRSGGAPAGDPRLQDETGGFRAFIPWSFQSGRTSLQGSTRAGYGRRLSDDPGSLAAVPRQRAAHPGFVGHPGAEDRDRWLCASEPTTWEAP